MTSQFGSPINIPMNNIQIGKEKQKQQDTMIRSIFILYIKSYLHFSIISKAHAGARTHKYIYIYIRSNHLLLQGQDVWHTTMHGVNDPGLGLVAYGGHGLPPATLRHSGKKLGHVGRAEDLVNHGEVGRAVLGLEVWCKDAQSRALSPQILTRTARAAATTSIATHQRFVVTLFQIPEPQYIAAVTRLIGFNWECIYVWIINRELPSKQGPCPCIQVKAGCVKQTWSDLMHIIASLNVHDCPRSPFMFPCWELCSFADLRHRKFHNKDPSSTTKFKFKHEWLPGICLSSSRIHWIST